MPFQNKQNISVMEKPGRILRLLERVGIWNKCKTKVKKLLQPGSHWHRKQTHKWTLCPFSPLPPLMTHQLYLFLNWVCLLKLCNLQNSKTIKSLGQGLQLAFVSKPLCVLSAAGSQPILYEWNWSFLLTAILPADNNRAEIWGLDMMLVPPVKLTFWKMSLVQTI